MPLPLLIFGRLRQRACQRVEDAQPRQRQGVIEIVNHAPVEARRTGLSDIASTPIAQRLGPVREIASYRRLCEQTRLCSVINPPFGNRIQLSQHCDGPTKAARTGRLGVADGATGTTFWADHQLGARAKSPPFEPRWSGFCLVPGAEFVGELPDALRAAFRDEDRDLAEPLRS